MEPGSSRSVARALGPLLLGAIVLAVLLFVVPGQIERALTPPPVTAAPSPPVPTQTTEDVTSFIAAALSDRAVVAEDIGPEGEAVSTIEVAPTAKAMEAAEALRDAAVGAGLEAYAVDVDGLDAETRLYAQKLAHRVRFEAKVPDQFAIPKELRPALVALVVTDLGSQVLPEPLRASRLPLTLAVRPFEPSSLEIAEAGARQSREILLQVEPDVPFESQWKSVPYASGVLVPGDDAVPTVPDPFGVVVGSRVREGRSIAVQWGAPERDTRLAFRRTLWLAAQTGSAALAIRADDPLVSEVLALLGHTAGIRPVLATEAARALEVKGPPKSDGPAE